MSERKRQLAGLEAELTALADELEAHIAMGKSSTKPVDLDEPIGRLSRMDAMQQQEMAAAAKRGLERRLTQVRAGLARLKVGEYGDCHDCEEPIELRRLKARPEARRCTPCQEALDRA